MFYYNFWYLIGQIPIIRIIKFKGMSIFKSFELINHFQWNHTNLYSPSVIHESKHSFSKGVLKLDKYTSSTIGKNTDFMIFEV